MFLDYIESAIDFPEIAYNLLEEDYRKAKFSSLDEYKQYVSNNYDLNNLYNSQFAKIEDYDNLDDYYYEWKSVGLEKYSKEDKEKYTEYICVDSYDNYYIFKVTSIMQYTIILDTYTIDLPEFTEKYNNANAQEKVILNLNKINIALNSGDYSYVYSKLAESFKTKNFSTLSSFETYAKANFFGKNNFEYKNFANEGETYYTYNVVITDTKNESSNPKNKTFIMKLRRRNRL